MAYKVEALVCTLIYDCNQPQVRLTAAQKFKRAYVALRSERTAGKSHEEMAKRADAMRELLELLVRARSEDR